MRLTFDQSEALAGRRGEPARIAMTMLHAVGRAMDATELIPIASAHIVLDAFAMGEPGADFIVALLEGGGRFVVPTTINAISYDRRAGPGAGSIAETDRHQQRMLDACERMGAIATCSCNPFSQGIVPVHGEHVAWSESATTAYVNSVLGARTNREGATAIASALTGLTPRYGMHEPANRRAGVHFAIDTDVTEPSDLNLLGALIARAADVRIPAISGLRRPDGEALFGFAASFSIAGNVSMFHIAGVTPEAPSIETAFGGDVPTPVVIGAADIAAERARYERGTVRAVNLVTIGAPHASIREIREVDSLLSSRAVKPGVEFLLTTSRSNYALAESSGLLERLSSAGVRVTADRMCFGCDLGAPKFGHDAVLATNSLKAALSAPGTREVDTCYGSARQCVEAAVSGIWTPRSTE